MRQRLVQLAQVAGRVRMPTNDLFFIAGATLIAVGAGLERLSLGLIVGGLLLLVVAIGGTRAG